MSERNYRMLMLAGSAIFSGLFLIGFGLIL